MERGKRDRKERSETQNPLTVSAHDQEKHQGFHILDGTIPAVKFTGTIESDNYSAGSAGWQISRDTGDAEFNDVTVRGTVDASTVIGSSIQGTEFLSSTSGKRIEINSASWNNEIALYTDNVDEDTPPTITSNSADFVLALKGPESDGSTAAARVNLYGGHGGAPHPGDITLKPRTTNDAVQVREGSLVVDGLCRPGTDNNWNLGNSSFRWAEVWAVNGTIQTSDPEEKTDLKDMPEQLGVDFLRNIRPVIGRWKNETRPHSWLLADDLRDRLAERNIDLAVYEEPSDGPMGIRYSEMIPILVKSIQQLASRVRTLERA